MNQSQHLQKARWAKLEHLIGTGSLIQESNLQRQALQGALQGRRRETGKASLKTFAISTKARAA